jgi:two-component system, LuxR family, sensor kinase FixL
VLNALEAAVAGEIKPPQVSVNISRSGDSVGSLSVQDTGPGPAEPVRDQLFDSFVTTKPNGAGLGLFVARQVAESHCGRLYWQRNGGTTSFNFEFPISSEQKHGQHTNC